METIKQRSHIGTIRQLLSEDIMQESVIYQDILQKGERRGEQRGRQEGRQESHN